jgi:glycosyltransferase involved in cell wall biosynthesis
VQYNPFSYSDRGINPWLAESLGLSRRILPDLKIALMGHELFVPRSNWKHNILSGLQRAQLWGILQQVDCSFGAITTWTQILHRWAPRKPTVLLPVGSNIPVAPPLPNSAKQAFRARLGIPPATLILGAFGTAHHAKLQNLILWTFEQLDRAGCPVHLLALGSGGAAMAAACPELLKPSLSATGFLRAQEISQHLQLMDLLLVPFADGLSTRRGSAIAGLAHGIPTLSTLGSNTDPLWVQQFALGLAPLEFQAFLDRTRYLLDHPEIRARHAQVGRELYEQYFAWEQISAQLMANLTKMSKTKKGL